MVSNIGERQWSRQRASHQTTNIVVGLVCLVTWVFKRSFHLMTKTHSSFPVSQHLFVTLRHQPHPRQSRSRAKTSTNSNATRNSTPYSLSIFAFLSHLFIRLSDNGCKVLQLLAYSGFKMRLRFSSDADIVRLTNARIIIIIIIIAVSMWTFGFYSHL